MGVPQGADRSGKVGGSFRSGRRRATAYKPLSGNPEPRIANPKLPSLQPHATCHKPRAPAPTSALSAQLLSSGAAGRFPFPLLELQAAILDETASPACLVVDAVSTALAARRTMGKAVGGGLIAAHSARTPTRQGTAPKVLRDPCLRSPQDQRADRRCRHPGAEGERYALGFRAQSSVYQEYSQAFGFLLPRCTALAWPW